MLQRGLEPEFSRAAVAQTNAIPAPASARVPAVRDMRGGLWCSIEGCHMGTHAERVAIKDQVSRGDQDAFALASHQKAIAAIDEGRFADELAPVTVPVLVVAPQHLR